MGALLAVIDLDAPGEDVRRRILAPLEEAERKAARRLHGAKARLESSAAATLKSAAPRAG